MIFLVVSCYKVSTIYTSLRRMLSDSVSAEDAGIEAEYKAEVPHKALLPKQEARPCVQPARKRVTNLSSLLVLTVQKG